LVMSFSSMGCETGSLDGAQPQTPCCVGIIQRSGSDGPAWQARIFGGLVS
jgi:hypothetical protein